MSNRGNTNMPTETKESLSDVPAPEAKTPPATSSDDEGQKTPDSERVPFIYAGIKDPSGMSSTAGKPVNVPSNLAGGKLEAIELLKTWPVTPFLVNKGKQVYDSLRQSSKVARWSIDAAKRVASVLVKPSIAVLQRMRPVVVLADKLAAGGLRRVQQAFPVVKESPAKVYEDIIKRMKTIVKPLRSMVQGTMDTGKNTIQEVARVVIRRYHNLAASVDGWVKRIEQYVERCTLQTLEVPGSPEAAPQTAEPGPEKAIGSLGGRLGHLALGAATSTVLFATGATVWGLSRVPGVRLFVNQIPLREYPSTSEPAHRQTPASGKSLSTLLEAETKL